MEQKDIDIYEILKGMPKGIELYTPMCGRVDLTWLATNKEAGGAIGTENRNGEFTFNKEGKYLEDGEVLLFPSNEMRDWSKFFKKGDVLESEQGICIFGSYEDEDTKLDFTGMFALTKEKISETSKSFRTADWVKSDHPAEYIKTVEKRLGGKLNLETLKIEKPEKPAFKPFDKVLVRDGKGFDWLPALFIRDRGEGANYRYKVLPLRRGSSEYSYCIPFEGNENLAFTCKDIEDLPF